MLAASKDSSAKGGEEEEEEEEASFSDAVGGGGGGGRGSGWSGLPSPTTALASTTPIAPCSTATVASAIAAASLA